MCRGDVGWVLGRLFACWMIMIGKRKSKGSYCTKAIVSFVGRLVGFHGWLGGWFVFGCFVG